MTRSPPLQTDPARHRAGASTVTGHFGELLQGRIGPGGTVALLTLPCAAFSCRAQRQEGDLSLQQTGSRVLDPEDLAALLSALHLPKHGHFRLDATMPVGVGLGASTAARVALARAAGADDPWQIAQACITCEGASDPLMFPDAGRLLWASREGRVLDRFPPLPAFEVLGGIFGPPQRTDSKDSRFPDISDLAASWQQGAGDLPLLARLASASAARCVALRGPADDPTAALANRLGALGWQAAHTGSARGLIFAPDSIPAGAEAALRAAGFAGITRFQGGERGPG